MARFRRTSWKRCRERIAPPRSPLHSLSPYYHTTVRQLTQRRRTWGRRARRTVALRGRKSRPGRRFGSRRPNKVDGCSFNFRGCHRGVVIHRIQCIA
eukprot:63579-Prymnesium_polylepis.1